MFPFGSAVSRRTRHISRHPLQRVRLTIRRNRVVLLLTWLLLYSSFALLSPPLLDDADSVHAEVAREMLLRHDPVTLYANGIRYLEKAPLLYWSMAASMDVFGVSTAAARFPLALYVLALVLCVEVFARRAFRSVRAGLYAAMALLLSFGIFIFTRILIPDAIVCLWLTASLYCFWLTENAPPERRETPILPCIGFAAACAMNILTKGLIGLVFPAGTVLLYLLITRGVRGTLRRVRELHPLLSAIVFLAMAAPWHVAAGLANPTEGHPAPITHTGPGWAFWRGWVVGMPTYANVHGWTWFYFMNEHLLRYLNLRVPRDYDTVPLVLFWGLLAVWLMPWSAFLPSALLAAPWRKSAWLLRERFTARRTPREKRWLLRFSNELDAEERTLLLLGIAGLLPVVFFSLSTRQEYYVLPAMPFLAMLIAYWLDREAAQAEAMQIPDPLVTAGQRVGIAILWTGCVATAVCLYFLIHTKAPSPGADLSTLLKQNPGDYALSFGHFLDLNGPAMGAFRLPLAITACACLIGSVGAWWLRREYRPHESNMVLALGALAFLLAAHIGLTTFSPVLTSEQLAAAIAPTLQPADLIVINGEYESGSTLGFYLQRDNIHILHGHSSNLWYGSFFTDAPLIFETDDSLALKWAGPRRVFLWTETDNVPHLPGHAVVIAESGGKEILSNSAARVSGPQAEYLNRSLGAVPEPTRAAALPPEAAHDSPRPSAPRAAHARVRHSRASRRRRR